MEVFGTGTDIIEVRRIAEAINKNHSFRNRVYTEKEIDYCSKKGKGMYPSFAARFAAKEAVAKSLAEGLGGKISLNEIELTHKGNGAPVIVLYGKTLQHSRGIGIKEIKISVSATDNFAIAFAISLK
ncbi:MAG: holo-ACP synthase [Actinobacteria bacterium]|nr:holo-ACP synthase [Actinomycetota bacterium]